MSLFDTPPLVPVMVNPADDEVGASQHFRELNAGAGTASLTLNKEGFFIGAETFVAAPFKVTFAGVLTASGATINGIINATGGTFTGDVIVNPGSIIVGNSASYHTKLNGSNGRFEFKLGATVEAAIYNDSGAKITLDTNDSIVFRRHSGTLPGTGYITFDYIAGRSCMDIEVASNARLISSTGTYLEITGTDVQFNKNILPTSDNSIKCGDSGRRWSVGYFEDIVVDDITVNNTFGGCGSVGGCSYIELNLLGDKFEEYKKDVNREKEDKIALNIKTKNYTGFEEGDVLVWTVKGLKQSDLDACNCVTAVSDERGMPIVIGAEKVKVIGKVAVNQFLVSSAVPGYARAWNDRMCGNPPIGTVIAQSMEMKLDTEPGLIMAMIRKC